MRSCKWTVAPLTSRIVRHMPPSTAELRHCSRTELSFQATVLQTDCVKGKKKKKKLAFCVLKMHKLTSVCVCVRARSQATRWSGWTAPRWGPAFSTCTSSTISRRFSNCHTSWSRARREPGDSTCRLRGQKDRKVTRDAQGRRKKKNTKKKKKKKGESGGEKKKCHTCIKIQVPAVAAPPSGLQGAVCS